MRCCVLFVCLAVLVGMVSGCGSAKPMSESEFKGFCYQLGDGNSGPGCSDIILICDAYKSVINMDQGSQDACRKACQTIARPQAQRYAFTGCEGGVAYARDWCQRYCLTAYPR